MKKSDKNKKIKVVVAMSGGVDSSVAAALLKQAGFDVVGIMMKFWSASSADKKGENRCCSVESEKMARLVAKQIGIPFYVINVEKEFKKKVVDNFLAEYKKTNTPNPCVVCNKEIKFGLLIEKALKLGADFVATGHYARLARQQFSASARPQRGLAQASAIFRFAEPCKLPAGYASNLLPRSLALFAKNLLSSLKLLKGADDEKDQSYFLWQLSQEQLKHVLFPVGGMTKSEVRKVAKKFDLPTAETPESQEVCFISDTTNNFLKKYLKTKPGDIVDSAGKIVGEHQGLWFYTVGQRKALGIEQGPWYVVAKDGKKNRLIVSKNQKDLQKRELVAGSVNWINPVKFPIKAQVKIRYKSKFIPSLIRANKGNSVRVVFLPPQKAITPGQSVVFYRGKELLGGGIIK